MDDDYKAQLSMFNLDFENRVLERISEAHKDGITLTHTVDMLYILKSNSDENCIKQGFEGVINELELLYNGYGDNSGVKGNLNDILKKTIEETIERTKESLNEGKYMFAIDNMFYIENHYLREHIPENISPDYKSKVHGLLARSFADILSGLTNGQVKVNLDKIDPTK